MAQTYIQLMQQIEKLQKQAQDLRRGEIDGVISRIREAITTYNLTAADLGLAGGAPAVAATAAPRKAAAPMAAAGATGGVMLGAFPTNKGRAVKGVKNKGPKAGKKRKSPGTKAPAAPKVVKFRNDTGGTWGGLGKRPDWLRNALAAGKQLSDFAVK
jgi:DNA-binding protein H-NS